MRLHRSREPRNPFMPSKTSRWYRGLCKKLRTPRLPPRIEPNALFMGFVVLMSGIASVAQGLDYIVRPEDTSWTLTILERSFPLDFWGWSFVLFASLAILGDIFEVWPIAIFSHGALFICYTAFGLGVFWSLIIDWRGYGWSTGFLYVGVGMFHALVADGCYDAWAAEWKNPPPPIDKGQHGGRTDV